MIIGKSKKIGILWFFFFYLNVLFQKQDAGLDDDGQFLTVFLILDK